MGSLQSAKKSHVVCVPAPYHSHIGAMLKLAKLLYSKGGVHITFVNTEFNHRRILKSRGLRALDGLPGFQFREIPDSLPPSDEDKAQDAALLCDATVNYMSSPFGELLEDLNNQSAAAQVPPVSCVASDTFISFATDFAKEKFGVPVVHFNPMAACSCLGFRHFRALMEKGLTPLKDISDFTDEYLNTPVDWIPGMRTIKLKDLPTWFRTTDEKDVFFNFTMEAVERSDRATAVIIHTFDAFESDVLNALSSIYPSVYAIGPLSLLLEKTVDDDRLMFIGTNLLKEDRECLKWLDSKKPGSVIYVNFGSLALLTEEQLVEFAIGLANSNHPFLWIIRPDLINGNKEILGNEFLQKLSEDAGMIADWCPQEEVLSHPAIGGFLTHCGWNSVLESVTAGVPMLCWPAFGDQRTNCTYSCGEWGMGIEIESHIKRDGVERLVRELMEGEKGKRMKERVMEWKKLAYEATGADGSSSVNLDRFMKEVLA